MIKIKTPLSLEVISKLKAGDEVLISGTIYAARDAAHKKFIELIKHGKALPFDIKNQIIYYTGPAPAKPGTVIGSAGPTTSSRMDIYTPQLLKLGLRGMIGKGNRNKEVNDAIRKYKAVYFLVVGGAGALIAKTIKKAELVAFPELGPEALLRLEVENLPVFVAIDSKGKSIFQA